MANNFKENIEASKKKIEIAKAKKAAKDIKQYGSLDAYKLMKKGDMYAVVFEGKVIGGASSKKDAEAAIELLKHCTGGAPLTSQNLYSAMCKAQTIITDGNDLIEAEADGTIKIDKTLVIDKHEYIVDDSGELYTVKGDHVCCVADIYEALEAKTLTQALFDEIIKSRINKWIEENYPDTDEDADWDFECDDDCENCEYFDTRCNTCGK